jgi:MFS family permease
VFRPFLRTLRVRDARLPMLGAFLGALPIGMLSLGVLLLVQATTGSFRSAGAAAAALSIGNAAGLAVQGRLIDRWGQTRVLTAGAVVCPAALVAVVVTAVHAGPLSLVVAWTALAGASIPATTTSMRVLWPRLELDPQLRVTAYALLATQFQIALVAGPLLVSGLLVVSGPAAAVLAAAALASGAGVLFATAPASRRWRPPPERTTSAAGWRNAGTHTLFVTAFGSGVTGGMLTVAIPAVAAAHQFSALAGPLFAGYSAGELLGGFVYGGRSWQLSMAARMAACLAGTAALLATLAPLAGHPFAMLPSLLLIGMCTAPVAIICSTLLDHLTPPNGLARAYTTVVATGLIGGAAGAAAAGTLAGRGSPFVLLPAAGAASATALWVIVRRRALDCRRAARAGS